VSIYADKKDGKLTGRWRVEVQYGELRKRGRFGDHAAALAAEKQWQEALKGGKPIAGVTHHSGASKPTTLSELLQKAKKPVWGDTTHGKYAEAQVTRIIEHFGDKKLDDVTTAFIDDVILWLEGEELASATINRYLAAVSAILKYGVEDGREYISKLPHFEWQEEDGGRIRVITPDEEARIAAWFRGNSSAPRAIAAFITVAIDTGCRRGELLALTSESVHGNRIVLWGATTKSGKTRPISLTQRSQQLLAEHLPWSLNRSQLRYWWDRMCQGLGFGDDMVLHACRHTCATRLLQKRVDIRTVQEWMGHANVSTTQKYLHTTSERLDAAAAALEAGLPAEEGDDFVAISGATEKLREVGERTVGERYPTTGTE
jgi:integrase